MYFALVYILTTFLWNTTLEENLESIGLKIREKEFSHLHITCLVDVAFQAWNTFEKEYHQQWLYVNLRWNKPYIKWTIFDILTTITLGVNVPTGMTPFFSSTLWAL